MNHDAPNQPSRLRLTTTVALAFGLVWAGMPGCVRLAPRPGNGGVVAPLDSAAVVPALIEAHNLERQARGLAPLVEDPRLTAAAMGHATDMAARRRMTHRGSDFSTPFARIERAGYVYGRAGENVAAGQRSVDEVVRDWMRSLGHRRNVLGNFQHIGVGHATDRVGTPYWCVTFGRVQGG